MTDFVCLQFSVPPPGAPSRCRFQLFYGQKPACLSSKCGAVKRNVRRPQVSAVLSLRVHPHLQISPDSCKLVGGGGVAWGCYFYSFIQLWPKPIGGQLLSWSQDLSGLPQNLPEDPAEGQNPDAGRRRNHSPWLCCATTKAAVRSLTRTRTKTVRLSPVDYI